jgi:hypothetical protein
MAEASESAGFLRKFVSEDGKFALMIEDNGKVGYAYLLDADGHICGDVWLYNRGLAPLEPEWNDIEKAPFANPMPYIINTDAFSPPSSASDFSVEWESQGDHWTASVLLRLKLIAKVTSGSNPGWAALASRDGPLAKVLK